MYYLFCFFISMYEDLLCHIDHNSVAMLESLRILFDNRKTDLYKEKLDKNDNVHGDDEEDDMVENDEICFNDDFFGQEEDVEEEEEEEEEDNIEHIEETETVLLVEDVEESDEYIEEE